MNELPTEEPVNGKKKNIRQILSVEEFDTQHIRICIHRILISIYSIAVSQLHQMQSIHRTMLFPTHPNLNSFNSLHPFFFLFFVLGNHVGKPRDHVLGDALPPAANVNDINTINTNHVHPNFCCVDQNLPQVHSVWRKQTVPLLFLVTAF